MALPCVDVWIDLGVLSAVSPTRCSFSMNFDHVNILGLSYLCPRCFSRSVDSSANFEDKVLTAKMVHAEVLECDTRVDLIGQ